MRDNIEKILRVVRATLEDPDSFESQYTLEYVDEALRAALDDEDLPEAPMSDEEIDETLARGGIDY